MANNENSGRVSIWRKDSGKLRAAGTIQATPEQLVAWANLPVNDRGQVSLDIALFANNKEHDRQPDYTGRVGPRDQPEAAKTMAASAYEDLPF